MTFEVRVEMVELWLYRFAEEICKVLASCKFAQLSRVSRQRHSLIDHTVTNQVSVTGHPTIHDTPSTVRHAAHIPWTREP